jgi:hypothetical protein
VLLNPAVLVVSGLSDVLGAIRQILLSYLVHMHSCLRSLRQGQVLVGSITWEVLPHPGVGRSGVRRLPGLSPSPSPGSGGAEFAVFRDLARVRALGRAERSFLWCLWQGLTACQSHSVKWHCIRSGAGGAVLLSGRSVERRSDGGHFGSTGARASE